MRKLIITLGALAVTGQALAQDVRQMIAHGHKSVDRGIYRDIIVPPIEQLAAGADLILEATITRNRGYLDSHERYVYTEYVIHPIRSSMARPGPGRTSPGKSPMILRLLGGEVTVDAVPVRIKDDNLAPFKNGDKFLLFLKRLPNGQSLEEYYVPFGDIAGMFKIEGGRTYSMLLGAAHPKELEGLPVDSLVAKALQTRR